MAATSAWSARLLGLCAGLFCAGQADAQSSSVTLYGSVDAGIAYTNSSKGHTLWSTEEGNSQPNRWGFRGNEDMGGGLHTFFLLENGYSVLNGAFTRSGYEFNRLAYVGISSNEYGAISLGHQSPFSYSAIGPFTSAYSGLNYRMFHPGNLDEVTNSSTVQTDNTIKYVSPTWAGLSFGGMLALGGTTNFSYQRLLSFAAMYENGPLKGALTWSNEHDRSFSIGPTALSLGTFQGVNLATTTYVADKVQNVAAGGSYLWGRWTLHAAYTHVRLYKAAYADTFQTLDVGANYQATPSNQITAGAFSSRLQNKRWSQIGLADIYFLSKTTQVYIAALFQVAGGTAAAIYSIGPSSTSRQVAILSGIHESF